MKMKHCNKCGEDDQGAFSASQKTSCRACSNAVTKRWHKDNPQSSTLQGIEFRKANPNYRRESYLRNREKELAAKKIWAKNNRGLKNAAEAKRRATQLAQTPEDANIELIKALYTRAAWLRKTFGVEIDVDHIIPLSKGGLHTIENLQLLPAYLNRQKGDKLWVVK